MLGRWSVRRGEVFELATQDFMGSKVRLLTFQRAVRSRSAFRTESRVEHSADCTWRRFHCVVVHLYVDGEEVDKILQFKSRAKLHALCALCTRPFWATLDLIRCDNSIILYVCLCTIDIHIFLSLYVNQTSVVYFSGWCIQTTKKDFAIRNVTLSGKLLSF